MGEGDLLLLFSGLTAGLLGGALGGALAGLAGIGGGLIYVPIFYAFLSHNLSNSSPHNASHQESAMAVAVFASMLAIVATGFASARTHWRLGHIDAACCQKLLPGLIIGAAFGLMLTLHVSAALVLAGLALLDGWLAWDYGRIVKSRPESTPLGLASVPIGYLSGSLGIGGGTMLVPLLRRALPLRIAVGTSAFCGMLMVFSALLLNLLLVDDWLRLLQTPMFFLLGAAIGLALTLPLVSAWAARLHVRMDETNMRLLLRLLFILLAAVLALAALWQAFV
ncbi:MAG: TSUP family transporter [Mariprofundaceae bacterium]|nr:TSUP family transporter [Mariprofundaceae bacterium]